MIDPRFSNAGGVSYMPGYVVQQLPVHRHRHRRHRKNNHQLVNGSPISRDESIHKVDHGHAQQFHQNAEFQHGSGVGVPYAVPAFGAPNAAGYYQQATYGATNFGQPVQYTGYTHVQEQHTNHAAVPGTRRHRHHRHHHRHHHHHGGEYGGHRSRRGEISYGHVPMYHGGYGHISEDLIFIERGDHSPYRQTPPPGYEYKGRIEVQTADKELYSHLHEPSNMIQTYTSYPPPQPVAPPVCTTGCPPGWQQLILSMASPGSCGPGGAIYSGQVVGGGSLAQGNLGGYGGYGGAGGGVGFGTVAPIGAAGSYLGQGQIIADYIVDPATGHDFGYGSYGGSGYSNHRQTAITQERVTDRRKIIEVWQKRHHSVPREKSRSRSSSRSTSPERHREHHPIFDFERFRNEMLTALQEILRKSGGDAHWREHDQRETKVIEKQSEVRVIVQPIQPVFYMPRPTETTVPGPIPTVVPIVQPHPQPIVEPKIVYVPRNVYVPVIKPVFVPRERVIVRPQVIHVARPVLVDRPVPITQRPIIIDRERPVPVPVRGAAQTGGSNIIREEYVYRDNLPVAYGGRCAEVASGINYGYMPTQPEHQYATTYVDEVHTGYQNPGPVINLPAPNQFHHSHSAANLNVHGAGGYHQGGLADLAHAQSASALHGGALSCTGPIQVLDTTVHSSWQTTDQPTLLNRYGPPALDIVQKTDQVEQQMFRELRHRSSSGGAHRSASVGGFGAGLGHNRGPLSTIPLGPINPLHPHGIPHQGPPPIPVPINY